MSMKYSVACRSRDHSPRAHAMAGLEAILSRLLVPDNAVIQQVRLLGAYAVVGL